VVYPEDSHLEEPVTHQPPPASSVSDIVVSIIRTVVPVAWGSALTWVATQLPFLEPHLNAAGATGLGAVLVATLTTLWYTLMRNVERFLPAWLTVLVLGANRPPTYDPTQVRPQGLMIPRSTDSR
jgi:hypothetical protein